MSCHHLGKMMSWEDSDDLAGFLYVFWGGFPMSTLKFGKLMWQRIPEFPFDFFNLAKHWGPNLNIFFGRNIVVAKIWVNSLIIIHQGRLALGGFPYWTTLGVWSCDITVFCIEKYVLRSLSCFKMLLKIRKWDILTSETWRFEKTPAKAVKSMLWRRPMAKK